jgi:predicted nucleic acid-binding protein
MIFVDSSVWVASFSDRHPHHEVSRPLLAGLRRSRAGCAVHSLAEVYATLTRLPGESRAHPRAAMQFIESMQQHTTMITLDAGEYFETIDAMSRRGMSGAVIYDALILACARKVRAERIYTWNLRHFRAVAPDLAAKIVTPAE